MTSHGQPESQPAGQHSISQEAAGAAQAAVDGFLGASRSLVSRLAQAGGAGAQAVVPDAVLTPASHMLAAMLQAVEQAPHVGDEIDIVLSEIHAKRLTIQAMTAELEVLDSQLGILERALTPVQAWSSQWSRVRDLLLHAQETD